MLKGITAGLVATAFLSGSAFAAVDVNVNIGAPRPPVPEVRVVEKERVVVRETVVEKEKGRKDQGKHKGQKKHHGKGKKGDH